MAQRDLSTLNKVTQVAPDRSGAPLLNAVAAGAEQWVAASQEAKITEGLSAMRLELNKMDEDFRVANEANPLDDAAIMQYKETRGAMVNQYAENVSPFYRRQFSEQAGKIVRNSDAANQAWAYKQSRVNTVNSINNTIGNNIQQAGLDGMAYANAPDVNVEAALNFQTSLAELKAYADKQLGAETSGEILKTYAEDYMKSFISGAGQTDPNMAMTLLRDDFVKSQFSDMEQYTKFHRSMEIRADRHNRAVAETQKLQALETADRLTRQQEKMSYAQLQQRLEATNLRPEARKFVEQMHGFSKEEAKDLSVEDKTNLKNKFNVLVADFINKDAINSEDVAVMQESVFKAMRESVLTKNEGFGLLNQVITPLIGQQMERAQQFETGEWNPFQENLGLDTFTAEVNKLINNGAQKGKPTPQQEFIAKNNYNFMLGVYLDTLAREAQSRQTNVAGLSSLPYAEERQVYTKALETSKRAFNQKTFGTSEYNGVVKPVRPALEVGKIVLDSATGNRYKFKGGNPNVQSNWELVK